MRKPLGFCKCSECDNQIPYYSEEELDLMIDNIVLCDRCTEVDEFLRDLQSLNDM